MARGFSETLRDLRMKQGSSEVKPKETDEERAERTRSWKQRIEVRRQKQDDDYQTRIRLLEQLNPQLRAILEEVNNEYLNGDGRVSTGSTGGKIYTENRLVWEDSGIHRLSITVWSPDEEVEKENPIFYLELIAASHDGGLVTNTRKKDWEERMKKAIAKELKRKRTRWEGVYAISLDKLDLKDSPRTDPFGRPLEGESEEANEEGTDECYRDKQFRRLHD